MPEYLAPGVYVEEVSFRSKSIEGVPTSTTGFAGVTHYGPVRYTGGPKNSEPRLITSFTEFERVYGSLNEMDSGRTAYLAHAARAYFENGGKRLYVSRVFVPRVGDGALGVAGRIITDGSLNATWKARWPGAMGNVLVQTQPMRTRVTVTASGRVQRVKDGAVIEVLAPGSDPPPPNAPITPGDLRIVRIDADGNQTISPGGAPAANNVVHLVELMVTVQSGNDRIDQYNELGADPEQTRYIKTVLDKDDPADENALVYLDWNDQLLGADAIALMGLLTSATAAGRLAGGNDGDLPAAADFAGSEADPDNPLLTATGLAALGEIDDIAIVAMPDAATLADDLEVFTATQSLITHAENLRYRIAVVDGPPASSMNEIRRFRGQFDSKYAALYHPYVEILDPTERAAQGRPPKKLLIPPSGFVCGIYARSDIERGVHKAPANEIVRGLTRFEANINKARQDVLNPEGINALRFFEGRGNRVWGARTMSSDPEWKYVNVRRLFIYIEHSIDKGTQWAVFEPNGPRLWANIRQTVEDFLLVLWRDGALLGDKPEQAYFVRCDRTTMTQNDLDNGRMICLVGVAPVKPAEFVIFRIGQWTGDAK
ncbi:MAG TPA: phage tail sheath subtilisin-like domain-containing protein, partial [Pyrinomonadaceae bacterium]|nr:phage tail sheath subtilisin-like domain-containing protein [Pyrinomonadaceae bacterium]